MHRSAVAVLSCALSCATLAQDIGAGDAGPVDLGRPGDAQRGGALYESRCSACHSLDANRVGPRHRGLLGRRAGSVADYDYSPALRNSRIVWSETTLDAWLADPQALVPGQKMGYAVAQAVDRADLIAWLKQAGAR